MPSFDTRLARIAILGWGSLLWDKRPKFDDQHEAWKCDGPQIRLEFSRISTSRCGALTLVIDTKNGQSCTVAYAMSKRKKLEDAITDLQCREGTVRSNIGYSFSNGKVYGKDSKTCGIIRLWCVAKRFDAVVWSDLENNFKKKSKEHRPFCVKIALAYLQALDPTSKAKAAEYIWRAPDFVDTPLRRALQTTPWFRKELV